MIELPEARTLAAQLNASVVNRCVSRVLPPTKPHKFCWFNGEAASYHARMADRRLLRASAFGGYAQIELAGGAALCVNDGVNVRLLGADALPRDYQLAVLLDDGRALCFTVAMYGGICLFEDTYENEYYQKSKQAIAPCDPDFDAYFDETLNACKQTLSAKAFLATEQRFPGLGNGVLQDILFAARVHPKRKLHTLDAPARENLRACVKATLADMTARGGRDTERDLYGNAGGYQTRMSKIALPGGCPACGGEIVKEAYLGGSVYYCPRCQRLD